MVTGAVEGWLTTEKNVANNSTTPDVALSSVVLVEDLRGNIVGGAELLVKVTVGVVDEGGAEINDLDLVELLVLLEENVLGLKISVHSDESELMT